MSETSAPITLRLEGTRARRGIALSDFETFIENFIAALRDFDRDQRGAPTRRSGHPDARAKAVSAFKLVGFREGSAVAEVLPQLIEDEGKEGIERIVDPEPLQVATLRRLVERVEKEEPLPEPVTDALDRAMRSAGEDCSLSIDLGSGEGSPGQASVVIDPSRIARLREAHEPAMPKTVDSISGRLHQVDFEPDRLAIRSTDGVDWVCSFAAELEPAVASLVNQLVWASGEGTLGSARRGRMRLDSIRAIEQGLKTPLFSSQPVPDEELAEAQGISGAQGLDAIAASDWDEEDDAFLAILCDD